MIYNFHCLRSLGLTLTCDIWKPHQERNWPELHQSAPPPTVKRKIKPKAHNLEGVYMATNQDLKLRDILSVYYIRVVGNSHFGNYHFKYMWVFCIYLLL